MTNPPSEHALKVAYLTSDFLIYAPSCLKISNKSGEIVDFTLNRAQLYLHERAEDMKQRLGYIRLIIVKGRQQGISTYIEARLYFIGSFEYGKRIFIMTHLDEATTNLFNMAKRYHDNAPKILRPHTKFDNAKELYFDNIDTRYSVSTAGSAGTGRSATAQYMHGSEVAHWQNAEKHMAGVGQIIPLAEGTEIFLESTGNGTGNYFHKTWLDAIAGKNDYEAVFIPWYWQEEYVRECPEDAAFDGDEIEYGEVFELTREQMYWKQRKIATDFNNDITLFDQEYPATIDMAFAGGTSKALIKPIDVARCMASNEVTTSKLSPIIIGVDPAEYGDDDTAIVIRWGQRVVYTKTYSKEGNEQVSGRVALLIEEWEPDAVCIDVTGIGTGVEAFLTAAGHKHIYRINNGETAIEPEKYRNRGAECWALMKEWITDKSLPASMPRNDVLRGELSSREYHYDASRRLVLQSKEDMRKKGVKSPNVADALALTFAVRVKPRQKQQGETLAEKLRRLRNRNKKTGSHRPGMTA